MADFFARVELHDADDDDYETLHKAMRAEGFKTTIQGSNAVKKLPSGLYRYDGNKTCKEVRDKAQAAAEKTGEKFSLIVVESETWAGYGLKT